MCCVDSGRTVTHNKRRREFKNVFEGDARKARAVDDWLGFSPRKNKRGAI